MIPLAVLRPEPGWTRTARAARKLGLEVIGEPLFAVAATPWDAVPREAVDALLLGSANAVRLAGPQLAQYAGMPTYAVGATTAAAAREAGLLVVQEGGTDLQSLALDIDRAHGRLLRLCGEDRTGFAPPPLTRVCERVVYAAQPVPLPDALAERLREGAVAALHSPRAARQFAAECDRLAIPRAALAIAALSAQVAAAAGEGWRSAHTAMTPRDEALLAMAETLCQKMAGHE